MMNLDLPIATRTIRMADYTPEFGTAEIVVWVNPPTKLLNEHDRIIAEIKQILTEIFDLAKTEGKEKALESLPAGDERKKMLQARLDKAAGELIGIFSQFWSQGSDDTRWTEAEIKTLIEKTADTDAELWPWLRNRTIEAILSYREHVKKN